MDDIFISYKREDRKAAERLAGVFEEQQWSVWWDRELYPGDDPGPVITSQLAGAKAVVVLWSEGSVNSDWVRDEADEGRKRKVLVPVLIDEAVIPLGFRQIQAANLSRWDGSPADIELRLLLRKIGKLIDKPVVARKLTAPERAMYFLKRHALLITLVAAVALIATAAFVAGRRVSDDDKREEAVRLMSDGLKAAGESNYGGAIGLYDEAVRRYEALADVHYHRAQAYINVGEQELALAGFRKALELNVGDPWRNKADIYITKIQRGPVPASTPTQGGGIGNAKAQSGMPDPNDLAGGEALPLRDQVELMFSGDRDARIEATTKLVIERKKDPAAVGLALHTATLQPKNLNGVVNTLVLLENVDPAILRNYRDEISRLFELVEGNGEVTRQHIRNVRNIMGG